VHRTAFLRRRRRSRAPSAANANGIRRATPAARPPNARSARYAGLIYATDEAPGIRRRRAGTGFVYIGPGGRAVSARDRARIRALVIPPAWEDVWIAPDPRAHVQATGRDARGRKQYRYHPDWSRVRDEAKYDRLVAFGAALPALRRQVRRDLRAKPLSREWALATVLQVLERTLMRVGNEEYARTNGSYGLTTLQDQHARIARGHVTFQFRAKSGVEQQIDLQDAELARRVKQCQDLPGQTLFQYVDDESRPAAIGSADVNAYLRRAMGDTFTAKDFRTWHGTVAAACALAGRPAEPTVTARRRTVVQAIDTVARALGNTRAVCRRCYIHPAVLTSYLEEGTAIAVNATWPPDVDVATLHPAERAVLDLLRSAAVKSSASRGGRTESAGPTGRAAWPVRRLSRSA
jgi:DNA topoisomerase-1